MSAVRPSRKAGPIRMSLSSRFENIEMVQHLCTKLLEGRNVPEETRHWILMESGRQHGKIVLVPDGVEAEWPDGD